jgi:hypothetical protein
VGSDTNQANEPQASCATVFLKPADWNASRLATFTGQASSYTRHETGLDGVHQTVQMADGSRRIGVRESCVRIFVASRGAVVCVKFCKMA